MANQLSTEAHNLASGVFTIPGPMNHPLGYLIIAFLSLLVVYSTRQKKADVPELNRPKSWLRLVGIVSAEQTNNFIRHSTELIKAGTAKFPDQPYRLYSYIGDTVDFHTDIPGFESLGGDDRIPMVVNRYLTKTLNTMTKPLSDQAALAISKKIGESATDWIEFKPTSDTLDIVAQVSTRIFMGEEACSNEDWLKASASFSEYAFHAVEVLRAWPAILRPWVASFLPEVKETRARMERCREALKPYVAARQAAKASAVANGEKPPVFNDTMEWFEREYGQYDPALCQVALSNAAIHTTSDLMIQVLAELARHPEYFSPLREEIIEVLNRDGLKKSALSNLKLLDSFIKECQRLKPMTLVNVQRTTLKPIKLSNGLEIPKGERLWIDNVHMWSDKFYKNPNEFNPYRFFNLRGTDKEHTAHLVSTSAEHLGFGHGAHACPGRFFAANELKVILCHILLKYDWKLPEGHDPKFITIGLPLIPDPAARILFKRRHEEVDLANIKY